MGVPEAPPILCRIYLMQEIQSKNTYLHQTGFSSLRRSCLQGRWAPGFVSLFGGEGAVKKCVGGLNIQNNIILNNYGNEDLSHITNTLKTGMLSEFCRNFFSEMEDGPVRALTAKN